MRNHLWYRRFKRALLLTLGIAFILLGIIGLALPFLQGFLFLAIGLVCISLYSPAVREWMRVRTAPYPKLHAAIEKLQKWVEKMIG